MNDYERWQEEQLPPEYRPLGAWGYFGYQLLFMIPLVGFICLIIFSFNTDNINRRNFARSFFCIYVILAIVLVLIVGAGVSAALGGGK